MRTKSELLMVTTGMQGFDDRVKMVTGLLDACEKEGQEVGSEHAAGCWARARRHCGLPVKRAQYADPVERRIKAGRYFMDIIHKHQIRVKAVKALKENFMMNFNKHYKGPKRYKTMDDLVRSLMIAVNYAASSGIRSIFFYRFETGARRFEAIEMTCGVTAKDVRGKSVEDFANTLLSAFRKKNEMTAAECEATTAKSSP